MCVSHVIEHRSWFYVIGLFFDKTHFTCIWVDLGCVKLLQETTFQDLVLKPSSLFKKSSKRVQIH